MLNQVTVCVVLLYNIVFFCAFSFYTSRFFTFYIREYDSLRTNKKIPQYLLIFEVSVSKRLIATDV